MATYSLYEAKARFSEVIRLVRQGRTVTVTYRGEPVAKIQPAQPEVSGLAERLRHLREIGVLQGGNPDAALKPVANRPGALDRFLSERDE